MGTYLLFATNATKVFFSSTNDYMENSVRHHFANRTVTAPLQLICWIILVCNLMVLFLCVLQILWGCGLPIALCSAAAFANCGSRLHSHMYVGVLMQVVQHCMERMSIHSASED